MWNCYCRGCAASFMLFLNSNNYLSVKDDGLEFTYVYICTHVSFKILILDKKCMIIAGCSNCDGQCAIEKALGHIKAC